MPRYLFYFLDIESQKGCTVSFALQYILKPCDCVHIVKFCNKQHHNVFVSFFQ